MIHRTKPVAIVPIAPDESVFARTMIIPNIYMYDIIADK